MEELGVTFADNKIYWNGREMTEEVIREFIAPTVPHAERLREFIKSLATIDEYNIQVDDVAENGRMGGIALYCSDKYKLYDITIYLYLQSGEEYAEISGQQLNFSTYNLEACLEESGYTKIYDKLSRSEATEVKVQTLEAKIESLLEKIRELEADIAERRLRPGGEEYEAARERFTAAVRAQDYE